jgi:dinuclear metal center YbgI/SA1388 family protein
MPQLKSLIDHLDALLDPGRFDDFGPNGLQVPGPDEVHVVATGVSAHAELFERAAQLGADLVVVHHGLFWDHGPRALDAAAKRRLQLLFDHDIGLAAYHLPLDGHPEVGNNALIAQGIGATSTEPFAPHRGQPIGVVARFDEPIARDELLARTEHVTGRAPLAFPTGPERVHGVGIVSGAGSDYLGDAIDRGLDAFITGEPTERVMATAREAHITFVAAGHYATETFGVRRLGELLAERFGVRHEFVDVPNPI